MIVIISHLYIAWQNIENFLYSFKLVPSPAGSIIKASSIPRADY